MPFKLFGKGADDKPEERPAPAPALLPTGIPFDALTDEWRLVGVMEIKGRLSDALNRREAISLAAVSWAPVEGDGPFEPAPGIRSVDPYDLIVVLGGADSQPALDERQREAHRLHKVAYDVALDCPPFRVIGTIHLFPGTDPARLLDRQTELFVPVTDALTFVGERRIGEESEVALVNRSYLKGVEQIDRRTNAPVTPLPGMPLGGTSFGTR
ncbi:MAG: hypothetical protein ACHQ02_08875 [Candidatus Limnocylindrales bacterium]|jgi:hypothetical protein